jgi:hypothetical protein
MRRAGMMDSGFFAIFSESSLNYWNDNFPSRNDIAEINRAGLVAFSIVERRWSEGRRE